MPDFSPEARKSAIWATDARRIATGRAADVWLEKVGQKPIDDLSDIEAVQWGLRLQAPIANAVGDRLNVRLRELDTEGTHIQHPWMRSHFDYISEDNKTLYEIKNYNAYKRDLYGDEGSSDIPDDDLAQCIHEAAVIGVDRVVLCVLFGGQELVTYPINVDNEAKEVLIQQEAAIWAAVQTQTPPPADYPDDLRRLYPKDTGREVMASQDLAHYCQLLKQLQEQIKQQEESEKKLKGMIQKAMMDASVLIGPDGKPLATWKAAKDSQKFNVEAFRKAMPQVYEQFMGTVPGSRRFLIK
jgi:predicted phage-related endonuclease